MAQVLEDMPEVARYVKNRAPTSPFPTPSTAGERQYLPDFIAQIVDGHGDCLNLLIEVSGEPKKEKAAKVAAARTLWVPGVNNLGQFGRWAFLEITDPWDAENAIRAFLTQHGVAGLEAAETVQ